MLKAIKKKYMINIAKKMVTDDIMVKLVAVDYNWSENDDEYQFFNIFAIVNDNYINELHLSGSNNGEIWDLEHNMEVFEKLEEGYTLYRLKLREKNLFPRAFVLKGIGDEEYFDNNYSRNYVVKKGRGGNVINHKKCLIRLDYISLYDLVEK